MINLTGLSEEALIKVFREAHSKMSAVNQAREFMRLDRMIHNRPLLIAESVIEPDRIYKFQCVEHFVNWIRNNGYPNASCSNVYKTIKGRRSSAYGYKLKYKEEK